jgi:hypothetical protein
MFFIILFINQRMKPQNNKSSIYFPVLYKLSINFSMISLIFGSAFMATF